MINFVKLSLGILLTVILIIIGGYILTHRSLTSPQISKQSPIQEQSPKPALFPLSIEAMRLKSYPGSEFKTEQVLNPGLNYSKLIVSYQSEGLKIYGLLTIPTGQKPDGGWPVIIFNHGYIPPEQYVTTERYVTYQDAFARNEFITFKSDYRGNGKSEGYPEGAYYSPSYATDVLNGMSSVQKLAEANPNKVGMWGHSMGGNITLRAMVINKSVKAGVIWGGVVGTYDDLMNNWDRKVPFQPSPKELTQRHLYRDQIRQKYGTPQENPSFWNSIDPNSYLNDISGPLQLEVGTSDEEVPWHWSEQLSKRLEALNKPVEFYSYSGADHNISSPSFEIAIQRSVDFFKKHLSS